MSGAQTFREALRALVFRWSASEPTAELIAELQAEIEVLRATLQGPALRDDQVHEWLSQ